MRLRSLPIWAGVAAIAIAVVVSVVLVQRSADDQQRAVELVGALGVEVQRQENLAEDALRPGSGFDRRALAESRMRAEEMLGEAIELDDDVDLRRLQVLLADHQIALDAEVALGEDDLRLRRALHDARVQPAFARLEHGIDSAYLRERDEARDDQSAADTQSAISLAVALLIAGIAFWRYRAAERGRRAEAALRQVTEAEERMARASAERFRRFTDNAGDSFLMCDRDGNIVDVNAAACEAHGYTRSELQAMTIFDISESTTPETLAALLEQTRDGKSVTRDDVHRRRDGSTFPVEARVAAFESGGEELLLALARDVTERLEREAALRFQATLLDQVEAAIVAVDLDGRVVHWNHGAATLLGWKEDEAIGRPVAELPLGDRLAPGSGAWDGELELTARDGRSFPAYVTIVPVVIEAHEAGLVAVAVDVSEQKELADQLERSQRLESVGQLAGGVAHDFNNLLAVILNFADFAIEAAEAGSEQHDDLEQIRTAASRAADLTRQLLVFSRREPVDAQTIDLNASVRETEGMLRRTIGEHIDLRSHLDERLWPIRAGAGQIEQVLVNLAVNARDAMPEGGRLDIATENLPGEPRRVRLTVSDTGAGMEPDVAARAFDPFFTTKPKGEGTGLGLATVYGIVSQAGGDVSLESEPGRGTRVRIDLPAIAPVEAGAEPESGAPPRGHGERVLVVEDEEAVRRLTSRILSENGYEVISAADGHAALSAIESDDGTVHLLVTDVVMPSMSGAELAERLLEARPDMRVLYMSGYTGDVVLRHGPRNGDATPLQKPFTAEQLLRRVRESLR